MRTPDPAFVKKLREVSKRLEVVWTPVLERWVIWWTGTDGARYRIYEVGEPNGLYRPLDDRTINMLKRCNLANKISDPMYEEDQQYKNMLREKNIAIKKGREEAQYRSKQLRSKWIKALENADRGIFNDSQLYEKKIFSFPKAVNDTVSLIRKLGKPYIYGKPALINP